VWFAFLLGNSRFVPKGVKPLRRLHMDLTIPSWLSLSGALVLGLFVMALFHWVFVFCPIRSLRLTKTGWKIVDYVWILIGALGVFGSVQKVHRDFASNAISSLAVPRLRAEYQALSRQIDFLSKCRTFQRSEHSPERFEDIVREA